MVIMQISGRPAVREAPVSAEVFVQRATNAFNTSLNATLTTRPPASELNAINAALRANPDASLNSIVETYSRENPNSRVALYYEASGQSTRWLFNATGTAVAFSAARLQEDASTSLAATRNQFVQSMRSLANQEAQFFDLNLSNLPSSLSSALNTNLQSVFAQAQYRLPITISPSTRDPANLTFALRSSTVEANAFRQ